MGSGGFVGGSLGAEGGALQTPRFDGRTLICSPERSSRHSKRTSLSPVVHDFTIDTSSPLRPASSFKPLICLIISHNIDGSAKKICASGSDMLRSLTTRIPLGCSSLIATIPPSWSPAPTSRKMSPGMNFLAIACTMGTQLFPGRLHVPRFTRDILGTWRRRVAIGAPNPRQNGRVFGV